MRTSKLATALAESSLPLRVKAASILLSLWLQVCWMSFKVDVPTILWLKQGFIMTWWKLWVLSLRIYQFWPTTGTLFLIVFATCLKAQDFWLDGKKLWDLAWSKTKSFFKEWLIQRPLHCPFGMQSCKFFCTVAKLLSVNGLGHFDETEQKLCDHWTVSCILMHVSPWSLSAVEQAASQNPEAAHKED